MRALRRDLVRAAYFLLQVRERNIHRALGFATIAEYGAVVGGLTHRQCRDFLLVAKRLPHSPGIQDALENGAITWSQARHMCTESSGETGSTLSRAIDSLNGRSTEEPRAEARDLPAPPESAKSTDCDGSHSENALIASDSPNANNPAAPSNAHPPEKRDAPLHRTTRKVEHLSAPHEDKNTAPAPARYVISLSLTADQYARWQAASIAARRRGDLAEQLLAGLSAEQGGSSVAEIILVRLLCPQCGQAATPTSRGELAVPPSLLAAARCDATIEDEEGNRRRTIAPRVRRQVLRRARYRCERKNCGQAAFLTVHHRTPHAGGGRDDPANLVVLCWRCHRAVHAAEDSARAAMRKGP